MTEEQRDSMQKILWQAGSMEMRAIELIEEAHVLGDTQTKANIEAVRNLLETIQDDMVVFSQMAGRRQKS